MEKAIAQKIGTFWSQTNASANTRWWHNAMVIRHINKMVCGEPVDGLSMGLLNRAAKKYADRLPLKRGISIGCGTGFKEMQLINQGFVESFDLFELSEERISMGLAHARAIGVEDKVSFFLEDAFAKRIGAEVYDLVHWNNSLHHMLDVEYAVRWSKRILKSSGIFYMDDFVGPTRFQWPDAQLKMATNIRKSLRGTKYLRNPSKRLFFSRKYLPVRMVRPDPQTMMQNDPSEAADSEQILPAIKKHFPQADIIKTGGVVYSLAFSGIIANFDHQSENDQRQLQNLLNLEKSCIDSGETHYAVCLAAKD